MPSRCGTGGKERGEGGALVVAIPLRREGRSVRRLVFAGPIQGYGERGTVLALHAG